MLSPNGFWWKSKHVTICLSMFDPEVSKKTFNKLKTNWPRFWTDDGESLMDLFAAIMGKKHTNKCQPWLPSCNRRSWLPGQTNSIASFRESISRIVEGMSRYLRRKVSHVSVMWCREGIHARAGRDNHFLLGIQNDWRAKTESWLGLAVFGWKSKHVTICKSVVDPKCPRRHSTS